MRAMMTATCVATPPASELGDSRHVLDTVLDAPAAEDAVAAVVALRSARVSVVVVVAWLPTWPALTFAATHPDGQCKAWNPNHTCNGG